MENIDKIYRPLMPLKKLNKNMNVVTEKNAANIIGVINRFLRKPCKILAGFHQEVIAREPIYAFGEFIGNTPVYSDNYVPTYRTFIGYCGYHPRWIEKAKGKWNVYKPPILSIHNSFSTNCIPIAIGDKWQIFGDRLVIYRQYNQYTDHTPWLRYHEIIRADSTDDEIMQMKLHGRINQMLEESNYDYFECGNFGGISPTAKDDYIKAFDDARNDFARKVESCILSNGAGIGTVEFDMDQLRGEYTEEIVIDKVHVSIDLGKFFDRENIYASNAITLSGVSSNGEAWSYRDFIEAMEEAAKDFFTTQRAKFEEKQKAQQGRVFDDYWGDDLDDFYDD